MNSLYSFAQTLANDKTFLIALVILSSACLIHDVLSILKTKNLYITIS